MRKSEDRVVVSVSLPLEVAQKVDKLGEVLGVGRGRMMRNIVESVIDDFLLAEKLGLYRLVKGVIKIREEFFKKKMGKGSKTEEIHEIT